MYAANSDYDQREVVVTLSDRNPFEELIFPITDDSEYEGPNNEAFVVQAKLDPNGQNSERIRIAPDLSVVSVNIIDNEIRPGIMQCHRYSQVHVANYFVI